MGEAELLKLRGPLRLPYGLGAHLSTLETPKITPKSLRIGHVYEEYAHLALLRAHPRRARWANPSYTCPIRSDSGGILEAHEVTQRSPSPYGTLSGPPD